MVSASFLFQQGNQALNQLGLSGVAYVCPICATVFDLEALGTKLLTREHAPPRSVGGRAVLLTCRPCNGFAGSEYDNQPSARESYFATKRTILSRAPGTVKEIQLGIDGAWVNASLIQDGEKGTFDIREKYNNPEHLIAFHSSLIRKSDNLSFQIKHKSAYIERRASISDLKSCFVLLAAKFGYSYALHDSLAQVRRQLTSPGEDVHRHIYTQSQTVPTDAICLLPELGLVLVNVLGSVHVLPWVSHDYSHFESFATTGLRASTIGHVFDLPKNFEAVLDKSRSSDFVLRQILPE